MRNFLLLVRTLAVLICLGPATMAHAQYFGSNKVEYRRFDFRILETEHFDVYYYAEEAEAARVAARLAERWYARLSVLLNHELKGRQPLVLYGSQAEFAQTNVVAGSLSDSIGGVTEGARRRIVMPFAPTLGDTDRVIGHELVHAFQFDLARHYGSDAALPLWFIEGLAEYLSRGPLTAPASMWVRDIVVTERAPVHLDGATRLSPYLFGHAFWSYLAERFGDAVVEKALKPHRQERRLPDRMRRATGEELDVVYAAWRSYLQEQYGGVGNGRDRYRAWTNALMEVGPSLSPDGARAVFFSEAADQSLHLVEADTRTGTVRRRLATTIPTAKFDSLQPLRSAGAWSRDGRWFAFAAVRQGKAALQIVDMRDPGNDRELLFPQLGQVLSPTWSPDGASIAFSAIAGGATDLYVTDVGSGALQQLTDDLFADLQPDWSHDGRTIAFVSERFSSEPRTLQLGPPRLGVVDVATRRISAVAVGYGDSQLNPQWSADDRALYFIGNPDGVANVFRVDLVSTAVDRITNAATAVTGLSPTGPALSVSADEQSLAFTVYANGRPRLVIFDRATIVASTYELDLMPASVTDTTAPDFTVFSDDTPMQDRPYEPRLSLERIGQPYLSSGGGPFGTLMRGGGGLVFGDMLGERQFGAAMQIGNRLADTTLELSFLNQTRRWTWGARAEIEPGLARLRTASAIERRGDDDVWRRDEYLRRMQVRANGVAAYPFNRALRVETYAGVHHAQSRRDRRTSLSSSATGRILVADEVQSDSLPPATVAEIGMALVGDTTVSGPTGPWTGSRYRLEVTPAAGQLSYTHLLADVRHYVMPVRPFTIAMRAIHSARYGGDANDARLMPNDLGSDFVRGYSQDQRSCRPEAYRCDDEWLGQRLLAGNVEIRFPLLGLLPQQLDDRSLPIDAYVFADAGRVALARQRANVIGSLGAGLRINALGLPLQVGAVGALDGPRPRWQFDLGFRTGF